MVVWRTVVVVKVAIVTADVVVDVYAYYCCSCCKKVERVIEYVRFMLQYCESPVLSQQHETT